MPRPILKRENPPSFPRDDDAVFPFPGSSLRHAHFPPSPGALYSTHDVHSPNTYDRSPIVIGSNSCALPERGCPGRTYTIEDPRECRRAAKCPQRRGECRDTLHPRALAVPAASDSDSDEEDEQHTPTGHYAPPLPPNNRRIQTNSIARLPTPPSYSSSPCPDLCSSSSESDESSDGFASPPPEWSYPANTYAPYSRISSPLSSPGSSYERFASTTPTQDRPLSFLPHPNPHVPVGPAYSYGSPPPPRRSRKSSDNDDAATIKEGRKKKKSTTSITRAMAGLTFTHGSSSSDDGCLGGF